MERKRPAEPRWGFTFVETLIALVVGAVVVGGGMTLYLQGNRAFQKTTEHASFREQAFYVLEVIDRDMDQLMVSDQKNPNTGRYYLIEPYELLNTYALKEIDPANNQVIQELPGATGLRFYRYHHTEMVPDPVIPGGRPRLVAQRVEYETKPIDPNDPAKGVNLLRNGKKINRSPLSEVVFQKEPMIVAADQIQGSPHAILTVTVIPRGGMWGQMTLNAIRKLREAGAVVSRTFHLVGYESMYTSILYLALQKVNRNPGAPGLTDLQRAIYDDARLNQPENLFNTLVAGVGGRPSQAYQLPPQTVSVEYDTMFDEKTASVDEAFASVDSDKGVTDSSLGVFGDEGFTFDEESLAGSASSRLGDQAAGSGSSRGYGSGSDSSGQAGSDSSQP